MSFSHWVLSSTALLCVALFWVGAFRPALVWPSLIASLIVGSGLMPFGLTVVDEVWVGSLLLGILFQWVLNGNKKVVPATPPVRDVLYEIHRWVFVLFTVYLLFQCARGMIVMESFRKIRWIVFFLVLGGVSAFLDRNRGEAPDRSRVAIWIVNSTIFYMAFYLIHGVTARYFRGTTWWDLQCKEMGTTAYALFPVALAAPASLIHIREGVRSRWLGEVCLVAMLIAGLYYDSRVAVLVLLGFFFLGIFYIPWRPIVRVGASYCLVLFLFSLGFLGKKLDLNVLSKDLMSSGGADEVVQLAKTLPAKTNGETKSTPTPSPIEAKVEAKVTAVVVPPPVPTPTPAPASTPPPKAIPTPEPKTVVPDKGTTVAVSPAQSSQPESKEAKEEVRSFHFTLLKPQGKRPHDIDRLVHAEVVLRLISQGGVRLWVGHGYRMSGRVASPILRELYSIYIPERAANIRDDESTEAFTAWVADTGIVGLLLLLVLFVLTTVRVFNNSRGIWRVILGCSTMVIFLWMLVINLTDIFLFFFSVLPSGIIVALSRSQTSDLTS